MFFFSNKLWYFLKGIYTSNTMQKMFVCWLKRLFVSECCLGCISCSHPSLVFWSDFETRTRKAVGWAVGQVRVRMPVGDANRWIISFLADIFLNYCFTNFLMSWFYRRSLLNSEFFIFLFFTVHSSISSLVILR